MSADPVADLDPTVDADGFTTVPGMIKPEKVLIAVLDTSGSMSEPASDATSHEMSRNTSTHPPGGFNPVGLNPLETSGVVFSRLDLVKHSMRTVAGMMGESTIDASLSIIAFDSAARTVLRNTPMKGHTGHTGANQGIDALSPGGATNIWDALRYALQEAETIYKRNSGAEIHICLLTDGEPTSSLLPPGGLRNTLQTKLQKSVHCFIHTFGFGYNLDSKLLYDLCVIGNGIYGYIPDCSMVASVFINFCSTILSKGAQNTLDTVFNTGREKLVNVLKEIKMDGAKHCPDVGKNPFTQVQTFLATHLDTTESPMCLALIDDIQHSDENKGQLMKALSTHDWFKRWGYNHILAYSRALEKGVCANFKDQALQFFATEEFKELQAKGNELFAELPAPIPQGYTQASFFAMTHATGFSMTQFNTADGGCFDGDCIVSMANGIQKKVRDCVKGDVLDNGSVIQCVVKRRVGREVKMVRFPLGLLITPWHPVRPSQRIEWKFPCLWMNCVEKVYMDAFYDFVLESSALQPGSSSSDEGHYILEGESQWATINGLQVITLGHGIQNDPVASHTFYGTQKVIDDLKLVKGWDIGYVEL